MVGCSEWLGGGLSLNQLETIRPQFLSLLLTCLNRENTHSGLPLGHADDRSLFQQLPVLVHDTLQITIDPFGAHVAKTKYDDAGQPRSTGCYQLAKVEVMRQENSAFRFLLPCPFRLEPIIPHFPAA